MLFVGPNSPHAYISTGCMASSSASVRCSAAKDLHSDVIEGSASSCEQANPLDSAFSAGSVAAVWPEQGSAEDRAARAVAEYVSKLEAILGAHREQLEIPQVSRYMKGEF